MLMIDQRREKILSYNSKQRLTPLVFITGMFNRNRKIVLIPKEELKFNKNGTPNRKQIVRIILTLSQSYASMDKETGIVETFPGRNRSAIDIWRHSLVVYPDMDIFLIMEALHSLCDDNEVFGQPCKVIRRAVFRNFDFEGRLETDMHFHCDEYNISFNTWAKLH